MIKKIDPNEWWTTLHRNWKCVLMTNLDVSEQLGREKFYELIASEYPDYLNLFRRKINTLKESGPIHYVNDNFFIRLLELEIIACPDVENDLKPLEHFQKLKVINLSGNDLHLRNIKSLSRIRSLEHLSLGGSRVTDLEPLRNLVNLKKFTIFSAHLKKVAPLQDLIQLEELYLDGGRIEDISSLKKLTKLRVLSLDAASKVSDISVLQNMTHLENLNMRWMKKVTDLTALSKLKKLHTLDISSTGVTNITSLSNVTTLENLKCYYTSIENLDALDRVPLKRLNCSLDSIAKLLPFKNSLIKLRLSLKNFGSIEGIEQFTKLEKIKFYSTKIRNLKPLAKMPQLKKLVVHDPKIKDLTPLKDLKNLEFLDISNTKVSNLLPLAGLSKMKFLKLRDTKVTDLKPLKNLSELEYLFLYETDLDLSTDHMNLLGNLKKLKWISLPGHVSENLKERLKKNLPNDCKID